MESLTNLLWDEWATLPPGDPTDFEVAGIVEGLPAIRSNGKVFLSSKRLFCFRRLFHLWKLSRWGPTQDLGEALRFPPQHKGKVQLAFPEPLFYEISKASKNLSFPKRWEWMRGVWGGAGSLYIPRSGYYLVVRSYSHGQKSRLLAQILSLFRVSHIMARRRFREGVDELVVRDQQDIVSILSFMGFSKAVLFLEEKSIIRSMKDRANKLVNCDSANINKSLVAAERQLEIAKKLQEHGWIENLPEPFKDLVLARLANPSISLRELGQILPKPVSKSTVEYRWSRLEDRFENLLKGDGSHVPGES